MRRKRGLYFLCLHTVFYTLGCLIRRQDGDLGNTFHSQGFQRVAKWVTFSYIWNTPSLYKWFSVGWLASVKLSPTTVREGELLLYLYWVPGGLCLWVLLSGTSSCLESQVRNGPDRSRWRRCGLLRWTEKPTCLLRYLKLYLFSSQWFAN